MYERTSGGGGAKHRRPCLFLFSPAEQAFLDGLEGKEFNVLPPGIDYERWSKALGFFDAAKTVAEFNSLRYTDPERFALLEQYVADVESGKFSPDLGFAAYEQAAGERASTTPDILMLENIEVGKNLGAARKSYDIMDLETGIHYDLVDGTYIQDVTVFAGKGVRTEFYDAIKYAERYGGDPLDWQHVKGTATIATNDGPCKAEIHWVQSEKAGRHEMFIKRWLE